MKSTQSSGIGPVHQTVAGTLEFKSHGKAIAITFTDQQLSPHAGSATFWGWLRPLDWAQRLSDVAGMVSAVCFVVVFFMLCLSFDDG